MVMGLIKDVNDTNVKTVVKLSMIIQAQLYREYMI